MGFEWYYRARDYVRFSSRENFELLIVSVLFGFILSFKMWGGESFDASTGLTSWLIVSIFVLILLFWNVFIQKAFSLWHGYETFHYIWFPGVLIGLFVAFVSFGSIPLLFPGISYYEHVKRLRLGYFRHGINLKDLVIPAVASIASCLFMAMFMSFFYVATNNYWFLVFIKVSFLYAFFSILPIPRITGTKLAEGATSGFYMFFYKRQLFIFMFFTFLAYAALIYFAATVAASFWLLILSLLIGVIAMFIFMRVSEQVV